MTYIYVYVRVQKIIMGIIYKTNANGILQSRYDKISKMLPRIYSNAKYSDDDYFILHQSNANYTEIIIVHVEKMNNHMIGFVSFLHDSRVKKLNASHRKLLKEMLDELVETTEVGDVVFIEINKDVPRDVLDIFNSFTLEVVSHHDLFDCYKIQKI